jgi:hypothetical protein
MADSHKRLTEAWRKASRDLGIEVEIPFTLQLKSGVKIEADVLVMNFGHVNGMFVSPCDIFLGHDDEIVSAGYGYCEAISPTFPTYDRNEFIDALNDWGWSGPPNQHPDWYVDDSP